MAPTWGPVVRMPSWRPACLLSGGLPPGWPCTLGPWPQDDAAGDGPVGVAGERGEAGGLRQLLGLQAASPPRAVNAPVGQCSPRLLWSRWVTPPRGEPRGACVYLLPRIRRLSVCRRARCGVCHLEPRVVFMGSQGLWLFSSPRGFHVTFTSGSSGGSGRRWKGARVPFPPTGEAAPAAVGGQHVRPGRRVAEDPARHPRWCPGAWLWDGLWGRTCSLCKHPRSRGETSLAREVRP